MKGILHSEVFGTRLVRRQVQRDFAEVQGRARQINTANFVNLREDLMKTIPMRTRTFIMWFLTKLLGFPNVLRTQLTLLGRVPGQPVAAAAAVVVLPLHPGGNCI